MQRCKNQFGLDISDTSILPAVLGRLELRWLLFPSAQILEEAPVVYLLITSVNSYLFDFDFDHQLIRPKPRSGNCKRLKRVGFTKLHARLLCLLQPKTKKTQNHMNRSRSHRSGVIYGNVILRKFQKSPGTYPDIPKSKCERIPFRNRWLRVRVCFRDMLDFS